MRIPDLGAAAGRNGIVPLLFVSVVVVLVAGGLEQGVWLANLHNGLLALAFTSVGAYILFQRPGHPEGVLFIATGAVEAVIFAGRQVARTPGASDWWGWAGVWPVAVGLALSTVAVICFPDGRLPSPRWRSVVLAVVAVAGACAVMSALWPVEYAATGVATGHPLSLPGGSVAAAVWGAVAHPAYIVFQLLWVPAVVVRWRRSPPLVRAQLAWVGLAVCLSAVALVVGLVAAGSPRLGLLTVWLVPVAAGWAIVHGEHLAAYAALSWLSRSGVSSQRLPGDLARAVTESLAAQAATLWMGTEKTLHAVGVWPERGGGSATDLAQLRATPGLVVRPVRRDATVIGALAVERPTALRLSLAEEKLVADIAAQAVLVIDHLALLRDAARQRATGDVAHLSPRERQILELMARGLSNAAISEQLHLSIKTVEPAISAIFIKLGLGTDSASNRRVLAVLAFLAVDAPE